MRGLIFDFDGVIADSEALANTVLAEAVTALGLPTTLDDSLALYLGKRSAEVIAAVEAGIGQTLPDGFADGVRAATLERFRVDLREVDGARAFLARFASVPKCIASSSSMERLRFCLDVLGLQNEFGDDVFSADMVEHGKPAPDIYLLAAERVNIAPAECLVIEDSVSGVRAGVAAGMTVVGLCAGSHVRDGHAELLRDAGAAYTATNWQNVAAIVAPLLQAPRDADR